MKSNNKKGKKDYFIAIGIIVVIAMMLIPLPTPLLDALMAINLMGSLAIILIVLYSKKPSEFSIFPTLLLIATVFGLGLNISSTRLILLRGAAFDGRIIRAFSRFVVGGAGSESLVIGVIIFIILIAVQLVVITRGATRSAEVAARFTLDSMVQKNLSIDSQVSSGAITAEEGMRRRAALRQEVDFYSAMDGASKFVSGNVKVGILITLVNIFGGLIVGICFNSEELHDTYHWRRPCHSVPGPPYLNSHSYDCNPGSLQRQLRRGVCHPVCQGARRVHDIRLLCHVPFYTARLPACLVCAYSAGNNCIHGRAPDVA